MANEFYVSNVVERYLRNALTKEAEAQRRLDDTIARLTSRSTDVADQYKTAPQPGHGPGRYTPQARATGRDMIALFIPDTAFKAGDWQDFRQARDKAISWLRSHKYAVVDSQKLCWGPAFDLDDSTLSYRDSSGTAWYNAAIEREQDFLRARVSASY